MQAYGLHTAAAKTKSQTLSSFRHVGVFDFSSVTQLRIFNTSPQGISENQLQGKFVGIAKTVVPAADFLVCTQAVSNTTKALQHMTIKHHAL